MSAIEPPEPVRPWSPYPVQDWSSLPEDPLATNDLRYTGVDPGWSAPPIDRDPRPGWLPLVVIGVVLALVAGGIYAAGLDAASGAEGGAARFAPADGVVGYDSRITTTGSSSSTATEVTEQARYVGLPGLESLDWTLALQLHVDHLASTHFWRSLSTTVGSTAGTGQTLTMRQVGRDITLLAETDGTTSYAYAPALLELPADAEPGRTWSSEGSAGGNLRYASTFTAESADRDCLRVSGTIGYATSSGTTVRTVGIDRTWCAGGGVVVEELSEGGTTTTRTPRAEVDPIAPPTADTHYSWSSPAGWQRHDYAGVSIDPTFGSGIVGGTPSHLPAAMSSSGILFRVGEQSRDISGFVPKTAGTWRLAVRMHPGGTPVTLAAFGRVVVATSSERAVTAYDDQGARLWQLGTKELVLRPPVRMDQDTAVFVSIAGELVAVDIATGDVRWQRVVGADVAAPLAVGDGVVVVLDRAGNATAFAQSDGAERWQVELEASAAGIDDGLLVAIADQSLEGVDLASGRRRWIRPFRGVFEQITAFGGHFVVQSQAATLAVDHGGGVRAVGPPYHASLATPDYFFGWSDGHTDVFDGTLAAVTHWPSEPTTLSSSAITGLPYAQGLVVVSTRTWDLRTHSDEP